MSTLNQDVVGFVEEIGGALSDVDAVLAGHEETRVKVAEHAPRMADSLIGLGLIGAHQRDRMIEKLSNHLGAVEIIDGLIAELSAEKTASAQSAAVTGATQGAPVPAPAPPQQKRANFIDRRRGYGDELPSEREFRERMLHR